MKTLRLAMIVALAAASALACNDSEDERHPATSNTSTAGSDAGTTASSPDDHGGSATTPSENGGRAGSTPGGAGGAAPTDEAGSGGDETGGAGGAAAEAPLEIIGVYDDSFGGEITISADSWSTGGAFPSSSAIVGYDNEQNVVYTQHPADDMYNPNKFAKTVYTEPANGSFYYCMIEYALDTLDAARASTKTADASDPENGGCSTFPWSKATAR